jgi:hypothetical protein
VTLEKPIEYITVTVTLPEEEEAPKAIAAAASASVSVESNRVERVSAGEPVEEIAELIDLDEAAGSKLRKMLGVGNHTIRVIYRGKVALLRDKAVDTVPEEFVKAVHGISEVLKS